MCVLGKEGGGWVCGCVCACERVCVCVLGKEGGGWVCGCVCACVGVWLCVCMCGCVGVCGENKGGRSEKV